MVKKVLILFLLLFPFSSQGQGDSIVINEIAWMGSMVDGVDPSQHWRYEWFELYNNADTVEMLDGWMLELYRDTLDLGIPLQGAISPRGYFLIGASDKIQGLDLNYKNLAGKFVNSGQKVVLKNNAGEIIDEVDATKGWPAGENDSKRTMELKNNSWQISANPGGTPRAQNSSGLMTPRLRSGQAQKLSFLKETKLQQKTEKLSSSVPGGTSPFSIAVPWALLAGALALQARRFLLKRA